MRTLRRARRAMYTTARVLGDVIAVFGGPGALGRRYVRKQILRRVGREVNKL